MEMRKCFEEIDFGSIIGFKVADVLPEVNEDTGDECGFCLILTNDNHVAVNVSICDEGIWIGEPYAVKNDLAKITDADVEILEKSGGRCGEKKQEKFEAYAEFMYNPRNSHNCGECPENENHRGGLPCGQQNCWVDCHCDNR